MASQSNEYLYSGDEYWFIMNYQKECAEVAAYLFNKKPNFLTTKESLMHATKMLMNLSFNKDVKEVKDDILSGREDEQVDLIYRIEEYQKNSVKSQEEERKYIELKPTKSKKMPKAVVRIMSFSLAVSAAILTYSMGRNIVKNVQNSINDERISNYIGMLASDINSDDYSHKRNIIDQNKYSVGDNMYAYDYHAIVNDILSVSNQDVNLLELCMYDAYHNLDLNKLSNIDEIFYNLKLETKDNNNYNVINNEIDNCGVYLEYVLNNAVKRGLVDASTDYYNSLKDAVNSYKEKRLNSNRAYEDLSSNEKMYISKITELSDAMRTNLGAMYNLSLEEQINERESKRGL